MLESNKPGVVIGNWQDLRTLALPLRMTVFVQEQGVPAELEQDEHDELAIHAVVRSGNAALATGRVVIIEAGLAKIGRLAVAKSMRGKGLGKLVLQSLIEQALSLGAQTIKLHAQCDAQKFYEDLGFVARGDPFMEAGIRHVLMVRTT